MHLIETGIFIGGQVAHEDMDALARAGVHTLINNRPEGEEHGQPAGDALAQAARAAGMGYAAIPVAGGLTREAITAARAALAAADGPVLMFCKSGMRSALLWAVVRAGEGADIDALVAAARGAGVELGSFRGMLIVARGQRG